MNDFDLSNPDQVPLGEMLYKDVLRMQEAAAVGAKVERISLFDNLWTHIPHRPSWSLHVIYRIAPKPTPDVIPAPFWPEWAKYAARDADGEIWVYEKEPNKGSSTWGWQSGGSHRVDVFGDVIPGTVPWQDSLQMRPEGV